MDKKSFTKGRYKIQMFLTFSNIGQTHQGSSTLICVERGSSVLARVFMHWILEFLSVYSVIPAAKIVKLAKCHYIS